MDPLSPSNANNSSFGQNFSNYVKSAKGKRVVKLAVSTLAVAGGITAAVVFFAVPSAALSPALAITAMAIGSLGLRHLVNTFIFAYRAYQAKKNTVIDTTPSAPSINVAALAPLKFGDQAFFKREVEFINVPPMSASQLNELLDSYSDFDGYNGNQVTSSVKALIKETYDDGTLMGTAGEQYTKEKGEILKMIHFVFKELIVSGREPTPKQKGIALTLGNAFKSCPNQRYRALVRITEMITGEHGGIPSQLHAEWNNRKMSLIEKIIYQRHKNCNHSNQAYADQLPHLNSFYVAEFGHELGFSKADITLAQGDIKKHSHISNSETFVEDFKNQLKAELSEFLAFVVQDTNRALNPNNKQQQAPLLNRSNFIDWVQKNADVGLLPLGFCMYSEDKDYSYPGKLGTCKWEPTADQEACRQPMMTLDEGRSLLQYFEVEIAGLPVKKTEI